MKKIIALISVIILILGCTSIAVFADENNDDIDIYDILDNIEYDYAEDLEWSFDEESKTLTVSGHGAIPSLEADNWKNTWHKHGQEIEKIIICDGITAIGTFAFAGLYNLKEVIFPETLECISGGAFTWCLSLEKAILPKSLKYMIGEHVFGVTALKNIILPDGLIYCDNGAILSSLYIEKIIIPGTLMADLDICLCSPYLTEVVNYSSTTFVGRSADFVGYKDIEIDKKNADLEYLNCKLKLEAMYTGSDFDDQAYIDGASNILGKDFNSYAEIDDYLATFEEEILNRFSAYCLENSEQHFFCEEEGIPYSFITETVKKTDDKTGVTAEYPLEAFNGTPEMFISEGRKNANILFADLFGNFTSYDISFRIDNEEVQPNGKVTVKIPLPENYNADLTLVCHIDNDCNVTYLDSYYENGYIVFETNHFSEYVLIDKSSEITDEPSTEPDEPSTKPDEDDTSNCTCMCHKSGFMSFIYKIFRFFWKIFKTNPMCSCGITHY